MRRMSFIVLVAALLLAATSAPASAQDPLGLIAPGLTASTLCPLVRSNPQAAIDAIASGAIRAYDQGSQAQSDFAGAMAAAVMAANANGCIDEVFEGVNQAIIKGGYKVEYVTGKALSLGVAQGTASDAGEILAKATAVVICRGGASASACAKAWNQAIKIDPVNGCAVLVRAYVHAKAYCSEGKAVTNVKATVFKEPLGVCNAPGLYDNGGNSGNGGNGASEGTVVVSQGPGGQQITYPNGMTVSKGWMGPFGHSFGWTKVAQGAGGQQITFGGRKMLAAQTHVSSGGPASLFRKLLGDTYSGWPSVNANSASFAQNNGIANGGVVSNSAANARGYPWNPYGQVNANSAATAVNNGMANGPVVASSFANAEGR